MKHLNMAAKPEGCLPSESAMNPLVTLAVPAFQRADLLDRALRSAFAQEGLAPEALEVLVIEDPAIGEGARAASPVEQLCRSISDPRLRYQRNPTNLGMVDNWNRCLRQARGRWVVLLHDDDWLAPDFVRQCLELIAANPALRLVGSMGFIERDGETPRRAGGVATRAPWRITPFHFLLGNPFFVSGVMMDRQMAVDFGGFDGRWYPTMDSDYWLRFCEAAPGARLPAPLVHYHIGRNVSLQPSVLTAYIVNDFKQRKMILEAHYPGNRWLQWHSRLKPYRERPFLEQLFRVAIDPREVDRALMDVGWRPVAHGLRWTYLPLRAVLELGARLRSQRLVARTER